MWREVYQSCITKFLTINPDILVSQLFVDDVLVKLEAQLIQSERLDKDKTVVSCIIVQKWN